MDDSDSKVLASPEIATLNNQEAYVHIGELIPYQVTTYEKGEATRSIQKEEIGVKLRVKPIINEEDEITVTVSTEVSSVKEILDNGMPRVAIRKAETTVRVRNRQKIQIGGMLQENTTKTIHRLPLLGQIPYLGYLFQHHVNEVNKTNLIIDIKPIILIDGEAIDEEAEIDEE